MILIRLDPMPLTLLTSKSVNGGQLAIRRAGEMDVLIIVRVSFASVDGIIGKCDVPMLFKTVLLEHRDSVLRPSNKYDAVYENEKHSRQLT